MAIDFSGKLDTGEILTGAPTIVELVTSDLTISSAALNTVAKTIAGRSVAIAQAVLFHVTGVVAGVNYLLRVTATTTATPAQTVVEHIRIQADR